MQTTPAAGGHADAAAKIPTCRPAPGGRSGRTKAPQTIAAAGLEEMSLADLMVRWPLYGDPVHHRRGRPDNFTCRDRSWLSSGAGTSLLRRDDGAALADSARRSPLPDHGRGPRTRGAAARDLRLRRPGAGQPGGLCGDAALAIRQHAAGAAGTRGRRPLGPGPVAEGRAAGRPGRLLRTQPVPLRAAGKRQEQPRPEDPRRPAGRLLDPLRHQRGQRA